jgi:hypothetical protein
MSQANQNKIILGVAAGVVLLGTWFYYSRRAEPVPKEKKEQKRQEQKVSVPTPKFPTGSRVSTSFGPGTVESFRPDDQIYTILLDVDDEEQPRTRSFVAEEGLLPFRPKYDIGEKVQTPYGQGVIESYRDSDRIYGVKYVWDDNGGAVGYLTKEAIEPYVEPLFRQVINTLPVSAEPEVRVVSDAKFPGHGDKAAVQEWLKGQGYEELHRARLDFTGSGLFGVEKDEIKSLIGAREGLRLWQTLHPGDEGRAESVERSKPASADGDKEAEEEGDEEEGDEEEEES